MRLLVLGAAAGGGFPQWNCNCRNCDGFRKGTIRAKRRTQSSIAVSGDSANWILVNASPDILTQLIANPALQPARSPRDTGIRAIILVDSQIDHTAGLLMLREGSPLEIYCTPGVHEHLTISNPILTVLESYCGVNWNPIRTDCDNFQIADIGRLRFCAIPVKSKPPRFSAHRDTGAEDDTIGLLIEDTDRGHSIFYAPVLSEIGERVAACMERAECILVDGTFWADDEMIRLGLGKRPALEMGHLALSGPGGVLEALRRFPRSRKILIHINNTNPILDEDSAECQELKKQRIEVAYDGMEIVLDA
jgi:pyrroloquinoline quinone biosynthesis protein B